MNTADDTARFDRLYWPACALLYLGIATTYSSHLGAAPSGLDDAHTLQALAVAPLSDVWGFDRFGHLRPLKSLLFWVMARQLPALPLFRGGVLGAFLVSLWLVQLLAARQLQSRWAGLTAAATWALNPTMPAVLCWLSAANLVLAGLGVLAYLYLAEPLALTRTRALAACACLMLAVLSHELALLAPVLWLLQERTGHAEPRARLWLLGSSACILTLWAALYLSLPRHGLPYRLHDAPSWLLSFSAARYACENLRLWLWLPGRFGVLLSDQPAQHLASSALAWLLLLAVAGLAWRVRPLRLGLLWCALCLVPLVDLLPLRNTPVAMHYLYLPGIGLALAAASLARSPRALATLALLWAAWLPAQHRARAAFRADLQLYAATLASYPDNVEARVNLVSLYLDRSEHAQAAALLDESLARTPDEPLLLRNQLELWLRTGRATDALALWRAHPELLDNCIDALRLAQLLEQARQPADALPIYRRARALAQTPEERRMCGWSFDVH